MLNSKCVRRICMTLLIASLSIGAACADTLSRIRDSGEFRLGHRQSSMPFSYAAEGGTPVGYTVDVCHKIFERVKTELKRPDLKLKYVQLQSSDRIKALKEHRIDVECGSTTHTAARATEADFSYSIFFAGIRFLARKDANLRDWEALRGKSIAVTEKSTAETLLLAMNKERNLGMKLILGKDHAEGFRRMQQREADAFVCDDALLYGFINNSATPKDFDFVGKHLSVEPYGIMSAKGDAAMTALIDSSIVALFKSGEIRQIYARWFERGAYALPMSAYLRESINIPSRFAIQ
jgi:glutamate/aspartate transport system substrate-binding protein